MAELAEPAPRTYATTTDLERRWRPFTDEDERTRAEVLLADAAARIDAECPPPANPTSEQLQARLIVSCEIVKRAMIQPAGVGVNSAQQAAGPYSQSVQFANPTGDLYLTKADRKLLGCNAQQAFTVHTPNIDLWPEHLPWCSLMFGGCRCSCGVDIAWRPIFERGHE
jgi:hypothetical protein